MKINSLQRFHHPECPPRPYFRNSQLQSTEKVNELGVRKRQRILHSHQSVPDTYMVDSQGMILPSCYENADMVEKIFRHPARLMMSIARKVEQDVEVCMGITSQVTMTDQEVMTQIVAET